MSRELLGLRWSLFWHYAIATLSFLPQYYPLIMFSSVLYWPCKYRSVWTCADKIFQTVCQTDCLLAFATVKMYSGYWPIQQPQQYFFTQLCRKVFLWWMVVWLISPWPAFWNFPLQKWDRGERGHVNLMSSSRVVSANISYINSGLVKYECTEGRQELITFSTLVQLLFPRRLNFPSYITVSFG